RVTKNQTVRRVMGASCVHGCVGALYAPCAREGNQMLQMNLFTSVEKVRGHTKGGDQLFLRPLPAMVPEALERWLRRGGVSYRDVHESATWHHVNSSSFVCPDQLITQRSLNYG